MSVLISQPMKAMETKPKEPHFLSEYT